MAFYSYLFVFLGGMLFASRAFAFEEQTKNDLNDIKTRLAALEKKQDDIITKEDKILEELDRVRIWVHKR